MTNSIRAPRSSSRWNITGRTLLAVFGGYLLASLMAILLSYAFQAPISMAIFAANHFSFALYVIAILWVFSAQSLTKVALQICLLCTVCFLFILWLKAQS